MIHWKQIDMKKMILLMVLLFVGTTALFPSITYRPALSPQTCATIGAPAPGSRDLCSHGEETLLQVIMNPTTPDFLLLLILGIIINATASTFLSLIVFALHQRLYAKS